MADTVDHNEEHDRRELSHDAAVGHETSDVGARAILGFLVAMVVSLALTYVFISWLFGFYADTAIERQPPVGPLADQRKLLTPPRPLLQVLPALDMQRMREEQDLQLKATGWVDREMKLARIPINSAIEIVAERGLPDWPAVDDDRPTTTTPASENTKEATTKDAEDTK